MVAMQLVQYRSTVIFLVNPKLNLTMVAMVMYLTNFVA